MIRMGGAVGAAPGAEQPSGSLMIDLRVYPGVQAAWPA
jgi:hypothetical protein